MSILRNTLEMVRTGEITCESVAEEVTHRIKKDDRFNAFLTVFEEETILRAREIDKKLASGAAGPLAGCFLAVKDIICMADKKVTCGSHILENFISPYTATVIEKLEAADAVVVGKTNMDEFAMGSSNENSYFGPVLNPVDTERVPGGSSGGSAAAVAAGLVPVALGSDTGGSIRQPAAYCGVVGCKPTYGRVSRFGLVAFASSLDQIGPIGQSVQDVAEILTVIAGFDEKDSTSIDREVPDYAARLNDSAPELKVAVPSDFFGEGLDPEINQAVTGIIDRLRHDGFTVDEVTLPHTRYAISTYYIIANAEASSNLARYDGARYGLRSGTAFELSDMYAKSRSEGFGDEVKRRIILGTYVLSAGYYDAYYRKAQKVRRLIFQDFRRLFREYGIVITPTAPTPAFKLGEKIDNPLAMYLNDIYTIPVNLAGLPGMSIPCGKTSAGLPIGLQLIGKHFDEETLLKFGHFLERNYCGFP
ncbi:Asp-tRNA(Asn)/Glu-tRNA(Gln) amidotransferase subunit GatA [candidate division KSB1 bacterium]